MNLVIENKYDFVIIFDVENGNPNGDPDAGNMPRIDFETNHGIITDVCIKRKIRNYTELKYGQEPGYSIFIREGNLLNRVLEENAKVVEPDVVKDKDNKERKSSITLRRERMCATYYDVRTFGAVMSTGDYSAGQVRGPVQLAFARSIDPIFTQEVSIARIAITNEKDEDKDTTFGKKYIVPYGLYRMEGFVSALLAKKTFAEDASKNDGTVKMRGTGFNQADLEKLWEAIINMFEHDHSASRGKMVVRKLIVFKHDSELGNAPSHQLFDAVKVAKKENVIVPRSFNDYQISIGTTPIGVTVQEKL